MGFYLHIITILTTLWVISAKLGNYLAIKPVTTLNTTYN